MKSAGLFLLAAGIVGLLVLLVVEAWREASRALALCITLVAAGLALLLIYGASS